MYSGHPSSPMWTITIPLIACSVMSATLRLSDGSAGRLHLVSFFGVAEAAVARIDQLGVHLTHALQCLVHIRGGCDQAGVGFLRTIRSPAELRVNLSNRAACGH